MFSSAALENLATSAFRIMEILSFMMAAIDIVGDGFDAITSKVPSEHKAMVMEVASFMGSLDKACRHAAKESMSILANVVAKQRSVLNGLLVPLVPRPIKWELVGAPLSLFEVTPQAVVDKAKERFEKALESRALIAVLATARSRPWRSSVRRFGFSSNRGGRGSGPVRRAGYLDRSGRGSRRAGWPRKRGFGMPRKSWESFQRRDSNSRGSKRPSTVAGPSSEGQQ